MADEFLKSEIRKIKENTHWNAHGENYEFIAKKIKSPLAKQFAKINAQHKKEESLNHDLYEKRYKNYQKLMKELKKKNPKQFGEIYGGL